MSSLPFRITKSKPDESDLNPYIGQKMLYNGKWIRKCLVKPALVKWIRYACHYVAVDWFCETDSSHYCHSEYYFHFFY
jgi:hypothetical protein